MEKISYERCIHATRQVDDLRLCLKLYYFINLTITYNYLKKLEILKTESRRKTESRQSRVN